MLDAGTWTMKRTVGAFRGFTHRDMRPATNKLCDIETCKVPTSRRRWFNMSFRLRERACSPCLVVRRVLPTA
jgi:hypothetical protein